MALPDRLTSWAKVSTTFTAQHRWEDAPDEVSFLKDDHRHEFHVTVTIEQFHDDRDVEYIMFKRALDEWLAEYPAEGVSGGKLGEKSCEMMAKDIIEQFIFDEVPDAMNRYITVEVLEDGENGALVDHVSRDD